MRASDLMIVVAPLGMVALLMACDKSPTSPSLPISRTPGGPYTTAIEIGGPATIAPGGTAQFSAIQHLSDGSKRDATTGAQWKSGNNGVISINSTGLASAHRIGDSLITVSIVGLGTGAREIIAVPDGTYRLSGIVTEADNHLAAVVEARVEAMTGGRIVDATTTPADGRYRVYGVSGPTQVRVTKTGYTPAVETVTVVDHQTHNFLLALDRPRPSVAGTYTLTITASPSCRNELPDSARQRTYTAVLTQQGPVVEATLTGAMFVLSRNRTGNHFRGRVEPQEFSFSLTPYEFSYSYYYYGHPYGDLVEQVDNTLYLVIDGVAVLRSSGRQFSGRLNGSFNVLTDDPRRASQRTAGCKAPDHGFVLSQR